MYSSICCFKQRYPHSSASISECAGPGENDEETSDNNEAFHNTHCTFSICKDDSFYRARL